MFCPPLLVGLDYPPSSSLLCVFNVDNIYIYIYIYIYPEGLLQYELTQAWPVISVRVLNRLGQKSVAISPLYRLRFYVNVSLPSENRRYDAVDDACTARDKTRLLYVGKYKVFVCTVGPINYSPPPYSIGCCKNNTSPSRRKT